MICWSDVPLSGIVPKKRSEKGSQKDDLAPCHLLRGVDAVEADLNLGVVGGEEGEQVAVGVGDGDDLSAELGGVER